MAGRIWLVLGTLLVALSGCLSPFTRQAGPKDGDKDLDVPIVAGVTDSERENKINAGLLQISGVGLVFGLDGTGDAPQGLYRDMLERELRKHKMEHVREVFDNPNNALVLVSAMLHGGMRKGDLIDVEITLPPNSRATSLRGGKLWDCNLRAYEKARTGELLSGDVLARAGGGRDGGNQLLVGLENPESANELRRARLWEGGELLADRPFYFVMKKDDKSAHVANAVAERLNGLFRDDAQKIRLQNSRLRVQENATQRLNQKFDAGRGEVAKPSKELIALNVPFVYCLNPERYLRVARLVPLRATPEQMLDYPDKLAKMLLDPKDTMRAALRLEALGQENLPLPMSGMTDNATILKTGLESPHPLVRFASAEALTYLGSPAGAEELGRLARKHQVLRFWCLLALANLNEAACRNVLTELLEQPDAELRYGAFFALRLLCRTEADGRDGILDGQRLNEAFWLHRVAARSSPLVHLSLSKRAEIVLFGNDVRLRTPTGISAGTEFTIAPGPEANQCVVSRTKVGEETRKLEASLQIEDILWKMADLGGQYPDVVDFLRKADKRGCLSCPLRIDALPAQMAVDALAEAGRDANFLHGE